MHLPVHGSTGLNTYVCSFVFEIIVGRQKRERLLDTESESESENRTDLRLDLLYCTVLYCTVRLVKSTYIHTVYKPVFPEIHTRYFGHIYTEHNIPCTK